MKFNTFNLCNGMQLAFANTISNRNNILNRTTNSILFFCHHVFLYISPFFFCVFFFFPMVPYLYQCFQFVKTGTVEMYTQDWNKKMRRLEYFPFHFGNNIHNRWEQNLRPIYDNGNESILLKGATPLHDAKLVHLSFYIK